MSGLRVEMRVVMSFSAHNNDVANQQTRWHRHIAIVDAAITGGCHTENLHQRLRHTLLIDARLRGFERAEARCDQSDGIGTDVAHGGCLQSDTRRHPELASRRS